MSDAAAERPRVFLQSGRDRRIEQGHPWAYSNEIRLDEKTKAIPPGALATLHRVDGKPLGVGSYNPHTLIAFRLFSRDAHALIDEEFFACRIGRALALRERLYPEPFYRLLHAEADGFPGLVCDRFEDVFVLQVNTAGMEALTPALLAAFEQLFSPRAIVLRNDSPARSLEGLPSEVKVASGAISEPVEVRENGLKYLADVIAGQKTGWFYDQRDSRAFVASLAAGGSLLDIYCHTGAFSIAGAAAGARSVLGVELFGVGPRSGAAGGRGKRCRIRLCIPTGGGFRRVGASCTCFATSSPCRRRPPCVRQVAPGSRQRFARVPQAGQACRASGRERRRAVCRLLLASRRVSRVARRGGARRERGRPLRPNPPRGEGKRRPSSTPAPAGDRLPQVAAPATRLNRHGIARDTTCVRRSFDSAVVAVVQPLLGPAALESCHCEHTGSAFMSATEPISVQDRHIL